jgi:3-oxoacyl-[acyl-carrier-protein] synthase-3
MALVNAGITATAKEIPAKVLTNHDLEKMVETSDEWIRTRTGIVKRHIYDGPTSDLAAGALTKLLEKRGMASTDLKTVIVATATPDFAFPGTASIAATKAGATNAWGFDLSAACSGFLYALSVAAQMVRTGSSKNVAVIGADTMSSIIDYTDRNTCILFGDGAAAVLVEEVEDAGIQQFHMGGDGAHCNLLHVANSGSAQPRPSENPSPLAPSVIMAGREVFKYAVSKMAESCEEALKLHNLTGSDIRLLVAHQANKRILDATGKKLKMSADQVYSNLADYGNTTGASIPICLAEVDEKGLAKKGDKILLAAFGGGFTWGAGVLDWSIN